MMDKKRTFIGAGLCFLASLIAEGYCLLQFKEDYFIIIGVGIIVLITAYFTIDSILTTYTAVKQEDDQKYEERFLSITKMVDQKLEDMGRLQKAVYVAMKNNSSILEESLKADQSAKDEIIRKMEEAENKAAKLIIKYHREDMKSMAAAAKGNTENLIDAITESMEKLSGEIETSLINDRNTANSLMGANSDVTVITECINRNFDAIKIKIEGGFELVESNLSEIRDSLTEFRTETKTREVKVIAEFPGEIDKITSSAVTESRPAAKEEEAEPVKAEPKAAARAKEPEPVKAEPKAAARAKEPEPVKAEPEPAARVKEAEPVKAEPKAAARVKEAEPVKAKAKAAARAKEPEPSKEEAKPKIKTKGQEPLNSDSAVKTIPKAGGKPEREAKTADPNKQMSQDDIAAMLAEMNGETKQVQKAEAKAEGKPKEDKKEKSQPKTADPNKQMSQDDIAAMLAEMNGETGQTKEEEPINISVPEDPNQQMSPDDIAALFSAAQSGQELPKVEPEKTESEPSASGAADQNKQMSPDEIAALIASMGQ